MNADEVLVERRARDEFLRTHYSSPMPDEDRARFRGLKYFAHDDRWRVAVLYRESHPTEIAIESTSGSTSYYTRLGIAECSIEGSIYELALIDDGDGGTFIPFRDASCGAESYGGGRYVGIEMEGDEAFIDFNRARNPWCVYDEEFVCPLPPVENWIVESIPAGEMDYVRPS